MMLPMKRIRSDDECSPKPPSSPNIVPPSEYLTLPPDLTDVDFSQRIAWRKYAPYGEKDTQLPLTPINTPPQFSTDSPALCFHVHATSGRARATTVHLPYNRSVSTPIFMPVGTKGTIKSLHTTHDMVNDPALNNPIILANTYHLALQPGTDLIRDMGGLHKFMGWDRAILTDSGGFQMVSLLKLAEITEEGVEFENPFSTTNATTTTVNEEDVDKGTDCNKNNSLHHEKTPKIEKFKKYDLQQQSNNLTNDNDNSINTKNNIDEKETKKDRMLLRPEDSISHQNNIGSDIIMALDDVVSSIADDDTRFTIATYRTLRWLDRCYQAHQRPHDQNLFAIVQGGLDTTIGGLREKCLAGFRARDHLIPGYAIGGLAGGESKDQFWRVVDQCCKALPDDKPRYLMGVGYPLDLVVCTALGVDMYDCVYPTRTARFGVALTDGESPGTMRLKGNEYSRDDRIIMEGCECQACKGGYSRARLHELLKSGNPLATILMTSHNLAYMMYLVRGMRKAIMEGKYDEYVRKFVSMQFRGVENGGQEVPTWVKEAVDAAGISLY